LISRLSSTLRSKPKLLARWKNLVSLWPTMEDNSFPHIPVGLES